MSALKEKHQRLLRLCNQNIKEILPSEAKYYLYLLVNSLRDNHTTYALDLLESLLKNIQAIAHLSQSQYPKQQQDILQKIQSNYAELEKLAQTHTFGRQIINILMLHLSLLFRTNWGQSFCEFVFAFQCTFEKPTNENTEH